LSEQTVPLFEPHPWLRGGDLQTIAGRYLPGRRSCLTSARYDVALDDGDAIAVRESVPAGWIPGDPHVLLVHGLGGCAEAPYVVRTADRLFAYGLRVVRMNLRGAGEGFGRARGIYHSGRTQDLRAVSEWMSDRAPGSPLGLVGFSLGGNLVLKLAAESSARRLPGLDCVVAACPPLDLSACCRTLRRKRNRIYDKNFVKSLKRGVDRLHRRFPDLGAVDWTGVDTLYDFDDQYTAPRNGFDGAEDYYTRSSAGPLLGRVEVSGLVVLAADDPFIPAGLAKQFACPPTLRIELIAGGGHLGFLSRKRWNGDCRWLDSRLATWLVEHWQVQVRRQATSNASSLIPRDIALEGARPLHANTSLQ
jgi:predicted alpha/beta-fold hydrolase